MISWNEISEKCPKLYKNKIPFECGKGWADIILELSESIEAILDRNPDLQEIYAVQVKEKYGTLHFYLSTYTEEIDDLIQTAEALSSITCECCGKMKDKRWLEVRCGKCN
jgi:hypothetical protein